MDSRFFFGDMVLQGGLRWCLVLGGNWNLSYGICIFTHGHMCNAFIKGSLDEKLPSYEVLKMLKE